MVSVGVIGASGYGGMELLRILQQHPQAEVTYVAGNHEAERTVADQWPFFRGYGSLRVEKYDAVRCAERCETVFVALPSGVSGAVAAELWRQGKQVIDLSGDLRLPSDLYEAWYDKPAVVGPALDSAVYGLTEWHRDDLQGARLVANPGCFASAILLSLLPVVRAELATPGAPILVDAKSGVSGAGRAAALDRQLGELADNFYAYRVGRHQHTPEVEHELSPTGDVRMLMTTQLLPIPRGIYATCYVPVAKSVTSSDVDHIMQTRYAADPFVHVLPSGHIPQLKHVRGTNDTVIGTYVDERTGTLQLFAALDNLQKGAAGQAVQNWNVMNGFAETTGLLTAALYP